MEETQIQCLISDFQQIKCQRGKDHKDYVLNLVCVDSQCNASRDQFEPMCCLCQEDNIHQKKNHETRVLKRLLKSIAEQLESQQNDNHTLKELSALSKDYMILSDGCREISKNINSVIQTYHQNIVSQAIKAENIIKQICNATEQQSFTDYLKELRKQLNFSTVSMQAQFKDYEKNQQKLTQYSISLNNALEKIEDYFNEALQISGNLDKSNQSNKIIYSEIQKNRSRIVNIQEYQRQQYEQDISNQQSMYMLLQNSNHLTDIPNVPDINIPMRDQERQQSIL